MKPWQALSEKAYLLNDNTDKSMPPLFYYDSAPTHSTAKNPPVFVLIHGLGDEADSWRHIIPLLNSAGYRTLAPDLPGFGRSAAAGKANLKSYADVVLRLIRAVLRPSADNGGKEAEPPVYLAGSSLGALIAEEAAFKAPDLVRGLVLIGGSIPGGPKRPGPIALAKLLFSRKWYRSYRKNPDGLWTSLQPYYADLDSLPPADKDFLRQRVMARVESPAQEQAFFAAYRNAVRTYLTASAFYAWKIRRYKGKIMLIWGESDRIMPLSSAKSFQSLRADITLSVISGAGHLPQQEKPEALANLMADFEKTTKGIHENSSS